MFELGGLLVVVEHRPCCNFIYFLVIVIRLEVKGGRVYMHNKEYLGNSC